MYVLLMMQKNPVAKLDTPEKRAAGPIHRNVYKIKHSNGIHHPERVVFPICIRRCVSDVLYDFLVAELKEVGEHSCSTSYHERFLRSQENFPPQTTSTRWLRAAPISWTTSLWRVREEAASSSWKL